MTLPAGVNVKTFSETRSLHEWRNRYTRSLEEAVTSVLRVRFPSCARGRGWRFESVQSKVIACASNPDCSSIGRALPKPDILGSRPSSHIHGKCDSLRGKAPGMVSSHRGLVHCVGNAAVGNGSRVRIPYSLLGNG